MGENVAVKHVELQLRKWPWILLAFCPCSLDRAAGVSERLKHAHTPRLSRYQNFQVRFISSITKNYTLWTQTLGWKSVFVDLFLFYSLGTFKCGYRFKRVVEKVLILLTHTHTNKLWVLFFKCVLLHFVLILSLEILLTWNFTSLEKTFWEVHLFALLQRVSLASRL